jgi:hypothetical protein
MVTFGHGYDICIEDNCNKNETSRSNLGSSYELENGDKQQSEILKQYLAGSHKFKVTDIEVYRIY